MLYQPHLRKDLVMEKESRVDWEKKAKKLILRHLIYVMPRMLEDFTKALSAAFEKGREAR